MAGYTLCFYSFIVNNDRQAKGELVEPTLLFIDVKFPNPWTSRYLLNTLRGYSR